MLLVVLPPFVPTDLLCLVSLRVRGVVGVQLHERAHHGVHSGGSGDQRRRSAHRDDWLAVLLVLGCECALHHAEICVVCVRWTSVVAIRGVSSATAGGDRPDSANGSPREQRAGRGSPPTTTRRVRPHAGREGQTRAHRQQVATRRGSRRHVTDGWLVQRQQRRGTAALVLLFTSPIRSPTAQPRHNPIHHHGRTTAATSAATHRAVSACAYRMLR